MVLVQLHILLPARVGKALRVVHIDHLNAPLPQPQGIPVLPLRCLGQKGPGAAVQHNGVRGLPVRVPVGQRHRVLPHLVQE